MHEFGLDWIFSTQSISYSGNNSYTARLTCALIHTVFIGLEESFCVFGHNYVWSLHDNCMNNWRIFAFPLIRNAMGTT